MRLNDTGKEMLIQLQREGLKYHDERVEKWILDGKPGKRPSIAEAIADHMIANDVVPVVRKAVKGYEGYYEVDQFGRVFGLDRTITVVDGGRTYEKPIVGRQMKQSMHDKGYKTVSLTKDGKTKLVFVHRIVAEAFLDNPDNLSMVNHKDEDKTNNFLENLEWCTAAYNRTYGNAVERHAKKIRGVPHTEEHKRKISEGLKRHYGERRVKNEDSEK